MNEENERPEMKLSPQQLATRAELIARGIPFTPAKVDRETSWAAARWLAENGYDFDVIADREEQLRLELEELAAEREGRQ